MERSRAVSGTDVQQSIFQQAQAAAAAQSHLGGSTTQESLLQDADLATTDAAEDEMPPPAYGDVYGEIRNEKDGLGSSSARVTDDGRVNIRINHLNRRLSQVFTPALRQHVQSVQDSRPPPPYIPPSLAGKEGTPPPPPLNVVIQIVGSRGDVQPFVALGEVLKNTYGHRVRLATHPTFRNLVQEHGLEFFSIGGDPSRLMAFMVKNPGLMPGFRSIVSGDVGQRRQDVAEYIQGCWRSCYKADDGTTDDGLTDSSEDDTRPFVADCIIANPPSFAHIHCAEKLGIPLHIMFTMPYSSTQAFPHPLANIQSSNADPQLTNYLSYAMIELLSWQGVGDIINRFRAKCLGLDPVSLIWAPGTLERLKVPHTYCWSPTLIPKPKDWGAHISISGFNFLASNYTPPPDLQTFLDAGPPPIYIGFGSIVLDDPDALTALIFEAVRKTGQRVLLSKGWGGIGADQSELRTPNSIFMLGNVPHDWLFKHVSCVVHHGGAGTTAAGIAAGRPTLVVPFFGDQPFWGAMVARAGAGPTPIPHKQLTSDSLADAIGVCLKPESLRRAKELASKIAAERGSDTGAQLFHQYLEVDRLRCTLAPSRAAAWRIKRTEVRLSAFAACTLANAKLLDFHELKLFRPQEYYTDEGPSDPISGGFTTFLGAFSSMTLGLIGEFPSETWKALQLPYASNRQQSQVSVSASTMKSEGSKERQAPATSPDQDKTSLEEQESLTRVRSPSKLSARSFRTSEDEDGSSSTQDALQGRLSPEQGEQSRSEDRSRNYKDSSKDYDMLRPTVPHTSKGLGRFTKTIVQSPMDFSVSFTKGFHNLPKLWGDDTVRPQQRVSDFKSGMQAVGKEFGFGMYDGVTGLVTQPWQGARKDGVGGLVKGIGKGMGGFFAKPGAALFGVLGHSMKGVHKEVQKLFGSNVQNYIVTSRTAQGYEEWLQSSDAERQDVIDRWKLVQKLLKKKTSPHEAMRDVLEAHQKQKVQDRETRQSSGRNTSSARSADSADASTLDSASVILTMDGSQPSMRHPNATSEESLGAAEINKAMQPSAKTTSIGDEGEDADPMRAIQETVTQLQRQRREAADSQADLEYLRQTMAASEAESQRQANEALAYERQLKRVMAQSLKDQRPGSDDASSPDLDVDDERNAEFERAKRRSEEVIGKATVTAGSPYTIQRRPLNDRGHLGGTTQSEFEEQQQGEKTTQEKAEEEIVMEYIKKQSLLEKHHGNKGKGRASATEDQDDEDLQKALRLSMYEHDAADLAGEAPRT